MVNEVAKAIQVQVDEEKKAALDASAAAAAASAAAAAAAAAAAKLAKEQDALAAKKAKEAATKVAAEAEAAAAAEAADAKAAAEAEARAATDARAKVFAKAASDAEAAAAAAAATEAAAMDEMAEDVAAGLSLTIKFVGTGETLAVTVPSSASTVLELKQAIQRKKPSAPATRQLLIAKGRQLSDTMTCSDARLAAGAVVHAGLKPADPGAAATADASSPSPAAAAAAPVQATASPSKPRSKDDVVFDTMRALSTMKTKTPYTIFLIAVNTLIRLMGNVLNNPGEARFCRVRYNNAASDV